ncbi:MAG: DNA replication/repair protein RecF [Pseudomonadota bacterium]
MTAVRALLLSHFRSHKVARLLLDTRPVALFGPNGAGKTNLLEAVSMLSPGRGLRRSSALDMTRRPDAIGWKIRAEVETRSSNWEIETWSEDGAPRQVRLDGKSVPQTALATLVRVLWLVPAMDRLWIEGAEGRRRFLDRMALSFSPAHAQMSLIYEKAMRERNRLLKDMVRDAAWYDALEAQMAEAGIAINEGRKTALSRIARAQTGAATAFPAADLELVQADEPMSHTVDALRSALAENRGSDLAAGRTLIGPHRADLAGVYRDKQVPAHECSTGEQKALLVSLILANARALAEDTGMPPLLLLDEVAAHLDPERRDALYDEIAGLGAQAWMTGTEVSLFDGLQARAQYFEVDDARGVQPL